MLKIKNKYPNLLLIAIVMLFASCERDVDGLEIATSPVNPDVYIDGFSAGLNYAAFGGSDVTAFDVDTEIKYLGTSSMRISVPDFEDPKGAYAGGVYFTESGRDLSGFDALTFWAKASQPANIGVVGIGIDLGDNTYDAKLTEVPVNTNWRKFYIPLPDASKLTNEKGMFYYSEGPEDDRGYTIWFDEVKFEKLGTIAHGSASIYGGQDVTRQAETGAKFPVELTSAIFNLPNGVNQSMDINPSYLTYESSDPSIATVNDKGEVTVFDQGTTTITARLGDIEAEGSLTLASSGEAVQPLTPAPTPDKAAEDVISLFSNAYEDRPVDFYNGYWEFSTTESETIQVDGDDILRYTMLNFVGIQFTAPTINISGMTHVHLDIWTPNATELPSSFKVLLVDLGPDGTFDGGDNTSHELSFTSPTLVSESWISLDIPLSDFVGLTSKSNLAQVVLSGEIPNVFMDNLYFYKGEVTGGPTEPTTAAPAPSQSAANVISIFSGSYTNIANNLNPDWGQGTIVTEEDIQGNNTMKYTNLDYQGIEFGSSQNVSEMEFLHIDYWTANSSALNVFLISPGPEETAFSMSVPTTGWGSVDIPLSDFAGVDLADIIQMKFDGNGTIYLDNIIFFRAEIGGGDEPTVAAPAPTLPQASVISMFSNSYNNVPVDTWRTDWSQATLADVLVAGNDTKRYSDLDFVGIETVGSQIDASGMTHFHIDAWSKDFTLFGVKLVDFGADGGFGGGDDVEHQVDFAGPAQGGWVSFDIPLSDFAGLTTRKNISQLILVGQPTGANTVFIDNVYFHN